MMRLFDKMNEDEVKSAGKETPKSEISEPIIRLFQSKTAPNKDWDVEDHADISKDFVGFGSCEVCMTKSVDGFFAPKMTSC